MNGRVRWPPSRPPADPDLPLYMDRYADGDEIRDAYGGRWRYEPRYAHDPMPWVFAPEE